MMEAATRPLRDHAYMPFCTHMTWICHYEVFCQKLQMFFHSHIDKPIMCPRLEQSHLAV